MVKILYIHHAVGWGGAPINLIDNINALDKSKYQALVLLLKDSVVSEKLRDEGIPYVIANSIFYRKFYKYFLHSEAGYLKFYQVFKFIQLGVLWLFSRYYFASKELDKIDFDIVQVNSLVLTDWLKPCWKKGRVVMHIQEPIRKGRLDFLYSFFKRQMRKYTDRIVAISKDNARRVDLLSKTVVIYNSAKVIKLNSNRNSYASKKFLYLGGSEEIKGFYTLVRALDYLDKEIIIYFGGAYMSSKKRNLIKRIMHYILTDARRKEKAIQKMRNSSNAIEIGLINDISDYLIECCALVSPFTRPHFSRPVIEALMFKRPAIGSDVKGMEEIIINNKTGVLFKKNDYKALAQCINALAVNPKNNQQMGESAYDFGKDQFSSKNLKAFNNVYKELDNDV